MTPDSAHGLTVARTMNGELTTGFDAKRVLAQRGGQR